MKLVLCTQPRNPGAWALRFLMWSMWSHSAIWDDEMGVVYDTTLWGGGCKAHTEADFFKKYVRHEVRPIEVQASRVDDARQWLKDQLGKGYDWTALLSWVVRRDWSKPDRWFCSEHSETFRTLFEKARFRGSASRITPQHQEITL